MYVNNGFILNVPNHLKPSYRISPFQTKDLIVNRLEYLSNNSIKLFNFEAKIARSPAWL